MKPTSMCAIYRLVRIAGAMCVAATVGLSTAQAAVVYTPTYDVALSASVTDNSATFTEAADSVAHTIDKFPSIWGTLTSVTAEYLSASGSFTFGMSFTAGGIASGIVAQQTVVLLDGGLLSSATDAAFEAAVTLTAPAQSSTSGLLAVSEIDGVSAGLGGTAFFTDLSAALLQFSTDLIVHADLNTGDVFDATTTANLNASYRVRYEFTESQAYIDAGSPGLVTGTGTGPAPVPEPPTLALLAVLPLIFSARRRRR